MSGVSVTLLILIALAAGLLGLGLGLYFGRARLRAQLEAAEGDRARLAADLAARTEALASREAELTGLKVDLARLETELAGERDRGREKLADYAEAKKTMSDAFQALAGQALKSNSQAFIDQAREALRTVQTEAKGDLDSRKTAIENLVKPLQESLGKLERQAQEMEKTRAGAYAGLEEQIRSLAAGHQSLLKETVSLVSALKSSSVRGHWGEMQLRRAIEMAGLEKRIAYVEQETVADEDARSQRPDMTVSLPGGKCVLIDSKAPLASYLEAMKAEDESTGRVHLKNHARQVRQRLVELSKKDYSASLPTAPDFVVMFLPGESILSAALREDPNLIQDGFDKKIIIASPILLLALLKSVAYGWQQEELSKNAQEISRLGHDLYNRLSTLTGHFDTLGKSLSRSVGAYNQAVGSLERNLLPAARRFDALGVRPKKEIDELESIDLTPRRIQAPELANPLPAAGDRAADPDPDGEGSGD